VSDGRRLSPLALTYRLEAVPHVDMLMANLVAGARRLS
jgi:hypothetical protein